MTPRSRRPSRQASPAPRWPPRPPPTWARSSLHAAAGPTVRRVAGAVAGVTVARRLGSRRTLGRLAARPPLLPLVGKLVARVEKGPHGRRCHPNGGARQLGTSPPVRHRATHQEPAHRQRSGGLRPFGSPGSRPARVGMGGHCTFARARRRSGREAARRGASGRAPVGPHAALGGDATGRWPAWGRASRPEGGRRLGMQPPPGEPFDVKVAAHRWRLRRGRHRRTGRRRRRRQRA